MEKLLRKPSKYKNKKTVIDGITFDSKREAARYGLLKALSEAGAIGGLRRQARYPLVVMGVKICTYVADFVYIDFAAKKEVVEDCKGCRTAVYKLKKKLMLACLGIDVKET